MGSYRLIRPLGEGGEGSVYLGKHLRTGRLWALKVIRRNRSLHEMHMMKRLSHPSLPEIIDVFEVQQKTVLVMEYIRGVSVEKLISRDRRLTREQTLDIAFQLCDVLVYLHGRKQPVLYLDLKPSNLILTPDGRICLTDFGSAVHASAEDNYPRTGTVGYAAPEQYDPGRRMDERADLFGFGALLYRLISGKKYAFAFRKSRIPGCEEQMEKIIKRCLERDPACRYASAKELQKELKRLDKSRSRERWRIQIWACAWLVIVSVYAGGAGLKHQFEKTAAVKKTYQALLEEASCAPEEKLAGLYREAIFLAPGRKEAWLSYLNWKDRDKILTEEEDQELRTLLHTIPVGTDTTYEELLARHPAEYGEVCMQTGLIYWYDYACEGGRRIGQGWFAKAAEAADRTVLTRKWRKTAELFLHIGSYYDSLASGTLLHSGEDPAVCYWEDCCELMHEELLMQLDPGKRLLFYESFISRMMMDAGKLYRNGITVSQMRERLELLKDILGQEHLKLTREEETDTVIRLEKQSDDLVSVIESLR